MVRRVHGSRMRCPPPLPTRRNSDSSRSSSKVRMPPRYLPLPLPWFVLVVTLSPTTGVAHRVSPNTRVAQRLYLPMCGRFRRCGEWQRGIQERRHGAAPIAEVRADRCESTV